MTDSTTNVTRTVSVDKRQDGNVLKTTTTTTTTTVTKTTVPKAKKAIAPGGTEVSYDSHAILINGKRFIFISAAIHYPRSTPAMWPKMMEKAKAAGVNCIETYLFWNLHEHDKGKFDFTEELDFLHFFKCAQDAGLYVIVRIGPYICAETNYGGYPAWLRDIPDIEIRTNSEPYKAEMERWVRMVGGMLRPTLAPNGGPVILLQIENEYNLVAKRNGEKGQAYLKWAIELAQSLELDVPWVMCLGGMPGAIETINGHYGHVFMKELREQRPNQPMIWTENWPGWYDTFTTPHRVRSAENIAYGVARFIAEGGTGVNYYMYHGGTNFGRVASFLQTTSYDYGAPLDEFGFDTTKSRHLADFHSLIFSNAELLLSIEHAPAGVSIGENCLQFTYGDHLSFLCNDAVEGTEPVPVEVSLPGSTEKFKYVLHGRTVLVVDAKTGALLYDSMNVRPESSIKREWRPSNVALSWNQWAEPLPANRPQIAAAAVTAEDPVEMLVLTNDRTDYTWYTTTLPAGAKSIKFNGISDVFHIFVNDKYVASTRPNLDENRTPVDGADFIHEFELPALGEASTLTVLVTAIGLIRGDWMIGDTNMVNEKKGIWGITEVLVQDSTQPVVLKNWKMYPYLVGEALGLNSPNATAVASVLPVTPVSPVEPGLPRWYISQTFDVSLDDESIGFVLNVASLYKGTIYINGRSVGRHFVTPTFPSAPAFDWLVQAVTEEKPGPPVQTRYHLPREWLKPTGNTLVILEEGAKEVDVSKVSIDLWTLA
ncbi:hypothetical protein HDU83_002423 [Entophlyctis luteolus]|nr:hypothetical protein HDU83_002423 [Entophlyctis luteolus]KAJ3386185.1 hypothetical protein HDU84_001765 [Entophlyctis sp. JEL0112]